MLEIALMTAFSIFLLALICLCLVARNRRKLGINYIFYTVTSPTWLHSRQLR